MGSLEWPYGTHLYPQSHPEIQPAESQYQSMTRPAPHSASGTDSDYEGRLLDARSTARTISTRLRNRQARIRRSDNGRKDVPPLVALLSGRGHTDKAMKLAVLTNWMAGSEGGGDGFGTYFPPDPNQSFVGPFTSSTDYDDIAELLLLERGRAETDRKIRRYLDQLAEKKLIAVSPTYERYRLLKDDGSGDAYTDPGARAEKGGEHDPAIDSANRAADRDDRVNDFYVRLPASFFRNGWFSAIPGPALIALLIHLDLEQRGQSRTTRQQARGHFVNEEFLRRYVPISKTSYERGVRLLRNWGLLSARTELIRTGKERRSRNRYSLVLATLDQDVPASPPERDPKLKQPVREPYVSKGRRSRLNAAPRHGRASDSTSGER